LPHLPRCGTCADDSGGIRGAERAVGRFVLQPRRKIGLGSAPTRRRPRRRRLHPPSSSKAAEAKPATPKVAAAKPADTRQAANRPPFKPAASEAEPAAAPRDGLVAGAQPIVQTNSFDSRFSATK